MKFKMDITASIATSSRERAMILIVMYVETFKTGIIIRFVGNDIMCLMSH